MRKYIDNKEVKLVGFMTLFIVIFMIVVCGLFFINLDSGTNSFEIDGDAISYSKNEGVVIHGDDTVSVYNNETGKVEKYNLEDYIVGVVSSEMPAAFDIEAIKAQAVAARTFYFSKRLNKCPKAKGADICNTTHCQVYMSKEKRFKEWGNSSKSEEYWKKICDAVEATKGQVLVYDDEIVMYPQFFSTSWGKTEDAKEVFANDVPYLKSIESPGEEKSKKYETNKEIRISDFVNAVNRSYPKAKLSSSNLSGGIEIVSRTESGAVKEIRLGKERISGIDFRKLFDLNSANFTITYNNKVVSIKCKGYGHGVGMSQFGADSMAKNGKTYDEILKHYYSGVRIEKIKYK